MPPRSDSAAATRDAIVQTAVEMLRDDGPVAFRIEELVRRTGVSIGGVYHHFGDRSGLVRAAYVRAVENAQAHDAAVLDQLLTVATTPGEMIEGLRLLTIATITAERLAARELRIEAMALARRDPLLRKRLVEMQSEIADRHVDAFRELQRRGWMDPSIDPYMLFLSLSGNTLGTIQDHLGPERLDPEAWARHTMALFTAYVLPHPST